MQVFFTDQKLVENCSIYKTTDAGHGRIEERICRATEDMAWLKERHPDWRGLRGIAALTSFRTEKKTGKTTSETRFYISSLSAGAEQISEATRAHGSLENNLHWMLDVYSVRTLAKPVKKHAALNLGTVRKIALGLLKRQPAPMRVKRKI